MVLTSNIEDIDKRTKDCHQQNEKLKSAIAQAKKQGGATAKTLASSTVSRKREHRTMDTNLKFVKNLSVVQT